MELRGFEEELRQGGAHHVRQAALEHFGISLRRILLIAAGTGALAFLALSLTTSGVLGQGSLWAGMAAGATTAYFVVSTPRRRLEMASMSQAKEAPVLAATVSACLGVTGSRTRTLLMLRSDDGALQKALDGMSRQILLGRRPEDASASAARELASYSAANALVAAARLSPRGISEGGEELEGISISRTLSAETKLAIFMAACFFVPILLLLYAIFSLEAGPWVLVVLWSLEAVALDMAFYLCSPGEQALGG